MDLKFWNKKAVELEGQSGKWVTLKQISKGIPNARKHLADMAEVGLVKICKFKGTNYYQMDESKLEVN